MIRLIRQVAAGLALLLALSGCLNGPSVRSMALLGGEVTATTPDGYCLDKATSRPGDGFAVIAPCATLGGTDPVPAILGVATVQVGPAGSGAVDGAEPALRDYLVSDAGAALLSASGSGDMITVLGSQVQQNKVKVHFADAGPPPIEGLQPEEWRAFLDMNGRLVTVAVRGLASTPLQDGPGAWLLDLMIKGLQGVDGEDPTEV